MTTQFRNDAGDLVCIRYHNGEKGGACLDFLSEENFNFYHNNQGASRMPVFGDNGTQYPLSELVYRTTGTYFLPNSRITFGEASHNEAK